MSLDHSATLSHLLTTFLHIVNFVSRRIGLRLLDAGNRGYRLVNATSDIDYDVMVRMAARTGWSCMEAMKQEMRAVVSANTLPDKTVGSLNKSLMLDGLHSFELAKQYCEHAANESRKCQDDVVFSVYTWSVLNTPQWADVSHRRS